MANKHYRIQVYRNSNTVTFTSPMIEATAPEHLTDFEAIMLAGYKALGKRRQLPQDRVIIQQHLYDDRYIDYKFFEPGSIKPITVTNKTKPGSF